MTVKELRNILAQFNDEMEVRVRDNGWAESIDDVDEYDGIILIQNIG